jgi:DNA polymerase-1
MPRHGGVRECFVARPGFIYSSEDYAAGELVTLADACLRVIGWSKLADALNGGLDPHLALAAQFCNKSYDVWSPRRRRRRRG